MKIFCLLIFSIAVTTATVFSQFSWTSITSPTTNDLYSVSFAESLIGTSVGSNGTIIRTTDSGYHWIIQSSGVITDLYSVYQINENNSFAVGDSGVILQTSDGGQNWIPRQSGTNASFRCVKTIDSLSVLVLGNSCIVKSSNNGMVWKLQQAPISEFYTGVAFLLMRLDLRQAISGQLSEQLMLGHHGLKLGEVIII
jgi:photosystem II stability/assembly factor-like uncharacterized protein